MLTLPADYFAYRKLFSTDLNKYCKMIYCLLSAQNPNNLSRNHLNILHWQKVSQINLEKVISVIPKQVMFWTAIQ